MSKLFILLLFLQGTIFSSGNIAPGNAEKDSVDVAKQMVMGWYEKDTAKVSVLLHEKFSKVYLGRDGEVIRTGRWKFILAMLFSDDPPVIDEDIEVKLSHKSGDAVWLNVVSPMYEESVCLINTVNGWRILNVIWRYRDGVVAEPFPSPYFLMVICLPLLLSGISGLKNGLGKGERRVKWRELYFYLFSILALYLSIKWWETGDYSVLILYVVASIFLIVSINKRWKFKEGCFWELIYSSTIFIISMLCSGAGFYVLSLL